MGRTRCPGDSDKPWSFQCVWSSMVALQRSFCLAVHPRSNLMTSELSLPPISKGVVLAWLESRILILFGVVFIIADSSMPTFR